MSYGHFIEVQRRPVRMQCEFSYCGRAVWIRHIAQRLSRRRGVTVQCVDLLDPEASEVSGTYDGGLIQPTLMQRKIARLHGRRAMPHVWNPFGVD